MRYRRYVQVDIEWHKGDTKPLRLYLKRKSTKGPMDITGASLTISVRDVFSGEGIIVEGPSGVVDFSIDTAAADLGVHPYGIELTENGETVTIMAGEFTLMKKEAE